MRILQIDERRATEPGFGVHWSTDLVVRSVAELSRCRNGSLGTNGADVALVEISDRPTASIVPLLERLRIQGIPSVIRIHGAEALGGGQRTPLGSPLAAAIEGSDLAFFGGRGELVRIASELRVAPAKARLISSPVHLPAERGGTRNGGIIGIGFAEGELPGGVSGVLSLGSLYREVLTCTAVALGPGMGSGYPALTHGLLARGIGVVGHAAQAALDGYPSPGWTPVSDGADCEEWSRALAELRPFEALHLPASDGHVDRWFECLAEISGREVLTCGRG